MLLNNKINIGLNPNDSALNLCAKYTYLNRAILKVMDKSITVCENKRAICEFYVIIGNLYVIILTKITINSLGGKYGYIKEKMG